MQMEYIRTFVILAVFIFLSFSCILNIIAHTPERRENRRLKKEAKKEKKEAKKAAKAEKKRKRMAGK